jgi:hypothetical protein
MLNGVVNRSRGNFQTLNFLVLQARQYLSKMQPANKEMVRKPVLKRPKIFFKMNYTTTPLPRKNTGDI